MFRSKQSGFTLWELIIVVVLVILLFLVAADRLLPLRGAAEQTKVLHTVGALRSALGLQATKRVLNQGVSGLATLASENPLDWLAFRPESGASSAAGFAAMEPGHWSWLPQSNILAYRLKYPQYVDGAHEGEWLRFQVRLDGPQAIPTNLALVELDTVRWQTPGNLEEVVTDEQLDEPSD